MIKRANEQLWCWKGALSIPEFYSVADPGEGPGGPRPPLFLDQTKARRVEKNFWRPAPPPPPYLRVWLIGPPSPHLKVWIRSELPPKLLQYVAYAVTLCSHGRANSGGHKLEHILLLKEKNSHDSFLLANVPRTSMKSTFRDLRPYKRTFYESFYTLPIITTKHKADNRVDSTVRVNQKVGYIKIYRETTREMGRAVLIRYD